MSHSRKIRAAQLNFSLRKRRQFVTPFWSPPGCKPGQLRCRMKALMAKANRAKITLSADRYFDPDPRQKEIARRLYQAVAGTPLICPHGHVDPRMFADPAYSFGTPA